MREVTLRLLLVEDNEGDVFLIKRALREYSIPAELTVCSDGECAARFINSPQSCPPPDAVILDLSIPRIDGLDLLRIIRNKPSWAHTPVMVFTSSPSPSDQHRVQLLDGVRFIRKPTGLNAFLRAVGDNVQGMLSEAVTRASAPALPHLAS